MISEEQLKDWEKRAGDWEFAEMEAHEVVPKLIAEVRRLDKEAGWLAMILHNRLECCEAQDPCPFDHDPEPSFPTECIKCWRDLARKRVLEGGTDD